ncbi:MAG: hypothetical protein C5B49_16295 [Bdellovibrio sp.]|nr:MAG: hypothetical protein C5B49_16295 [Bdellovibrio sp.]
MDPEIDMVAILKDELLPGLPLPTDVFLKLSNGKYVLLAKAGTKSSLGELHVSQSDQVSAFYIRRNDYLLAVEQNLKIAGILARRNDIPVPRRSLFLRTAAASVFKEMEYTGVHAKAISHSKQVVGALCTLVQSRNDYFQVVSAIHELPGNAMKEALAGAALCVLIARELGWQQQTNVEKLALGAFVRDVGLKEIPPEIVAKERLYMTAEERSTWETHSFRGAEILQAIADTPPEVIAIAMEHHENALGQGFPQRLRDIKMHPYAKIVCLIDAFVALTIPGPGKTNVKNHNQAMLHIELAMGCPYNKAIVVALKRALGIDTVNMNNDGFGMSEAA